MKKKVVIHEGFAPYLTLHYFKRRCDMLSAHRKENGPELGRDCRGAFTGVEIALKYNNVASESDSSRDWTIGDMWLCEDSLDPEILAHECLHAAQTFERVVHGFDLNYGSIKEHINGHEERVAYLLTDIMAKVILALKPNIVYHIQILEKVKR